MARRWQKPGEDSRLAWIGAVCVLGAYAMTGVAAAGSRNGWWPTTPALEVIPWASALSTVALVTAVLARFRRRKRGDGVAVVAILLSALFLATAANDAIRDRSAAGLKDVSTDLLDPPTFAGDVQADLHEAIPAGNRPGFDQLSPDERWRAVHAQAYPGLSGALLTVSPAAALVRAHQAAEELGWRVVRTSSDGFEAEARTKLFGILDRIAVRVRPVEGGSRVDVRSVRSDGPHDRGQGIRNVRRLLERLNGDGGD